MKKTLVIILLLVAIALALPFADGLWVKKKYYDLNKLVSQRTPFSMQVIDYRRGWFSSTATIRVSADAQDNNKYIDFSAQGKTHFIVKEKLYHGPIILRSDKPFDTFGKSITWALALSEIQVNQPDLQLSSLAVYHYNGSVSVNFDSPTITSPATQPGSSYVIHGLKGTFSFSRRLKHGQGEITLLSADIPLHDGHQIIKNATYTYSLDKQAFNFWYGKRSLHVGDLELNTSEKIQLQGLSLSISDNTTTHDLNSNLSASVDSLKLNNTAYGKQHIAFNVANLNLDALSELGLTADALDQQGSAFALRALELTPLALKLMSKGLDLNLSALDLNTKWGSVRGNASLSIAKQAGTHLQFQSLLASTTGQADFSFPAKLLEDLLEARYQSVTTIQQQDTNATAPQTLAKENIDRWILAGWLIPNGDHYQVNVMYKMNQLLLNGKPMKLPSLPIPDSQPTTPQR